MYNNLNSNILVDIIYLDEKNILSYSDKFIYSDNLYILWLYRFNEPFWRVVKGMNENYRLPEESY